MSTDPNLVDVRDVTPRQDLPAGDFSAWLHQTRSAQQEGGSADVPCGDCSACCTSSYFIHIAPDETQTLRRIPKALLFPAPGLPKGNVLLGYDDKGRCPMLIDNKCSIYADRPQTCRSYDCRVFPAAGIDAGDKDKATINRRIRRWKFAYPAETHRHEHIAVQAAATFLRDHAECFADGFVPRNPTQQAILAIKVYDVFLDDPDAPDASRRAPAADRDIANAIMAKLKQFDARRDEGSDVRGSS
jgi:uncharacterized protein